MDLNLDAVLESFNQTKEKPPQIPDALRSTAATLAERSLMIGELRALIRVVMRLIEIDASPEYIASLTDIPPEAQEELKARMKEAETVH